MSRLRSGAGAAGRLRMPAGWKGPAVRENSSDRCHGAVPEAQAARRLPMVWAMAGIGVCMAADGRSCYRAVGACPA
jgi:hypothetical protein